MLLKAKEDFPQSWINGDGENDIKAGKAVGCRTALIGKDDYGQDATGESLVGLE